MALCPNCQSDKHIECCERCGKVIPPQRRGLRFCTVKCQNLQAASDKISEQMREDYEAQERKKTR